MRLNQGLADGEAETKSSQLSSRALLERIENFWQRLGFDSETGIGNLDAQLPGRIVAGRNRDLPAKGGEFHGVVDQVPEDLLESGWIGAEMHFFVVQDQTKLQIFSIDLALVNIERVLQEGVSIDHLEIKLHLAFTDACEIEQVVDEPRFQLHIATNHLERFVDIFRQSFFLQIYGGGDNRRQRRAQFVTEHGKELILRQVGTRFFLKFLVGFL